MKGRLVKSAAFSALALSTLAGSVMLSGGEAMAACGDLLLPSTTCDVTDSNFIPSAHRKRATLLLNDLPASTNVALELTGLTYPNSQVQIDTDFNPGPLVGPGSRFAQYTIEDLTPGFEINGFDLAFDGMNPVTGTRPRVVKEIFATNDFTATPILTLIQDGPGSTPVVGVPRQRQYWFRDTFTPGDGTIDNAINTVRNVPGPLPVLGAGAAFGFSRKLRSRIKATSIA